jgi:hypothetical protein
MKKQIGWLTFIMAVAFAVGHFVTMVGMAWFGLDSGNALWGYFGFDCNSGAVGRDEAIAA